MTEITEQTPKRRVRRTAPESGVSGKSVVVCLNHPSGITFPIGPDNRPVHIRGNAHDLRGREKGVIPVGEYGYTIVSKDDWEEIKRVYGRMKIFESGLIFAESGHDRAKARACEQQELRHGREPVDTAQTNTSEANPADLPG